MRQQVLEAAFRLNRTAAGVDAISMRALAAELGLSAMGLYRYFGNKAAVLQAMWEVMLTQALAFTSASSRQGATARDRLHNGIEAFLRYWEEHPDQFRLVFMTAETLNPAPDSAFTDSEVYQRALRHGTATIEDFIREVGGDPARAGRARDLRHALMVGYLHARLANRRFPWGSFDTLREDTVHAIVLGIETCVRAGPAGSG